MEIGGPAVAAGDHVPRYIGAIAELRDRKDHVVGWVYLVSDLKGRELQYAQANRKMSHSDMTALGLMDGSNLSSLSILNHSLPNDLEVRPCPATSSRK